MGLEEKLPSGVLLTTVEGVVPLTHQMVVDGKEYRFSAVSSAARFVEMTAQVCALPEFGDDPTVSAREGDGSDMAAPERDAPAPDAAAAEPWLD